MIHRGCKIVENSRPIRLSFKTHSDRVKHVLMEMKQHDTKATRKTVFETKVKLREYRRWLYHSLWPKIYSKNPIGQQANIIKTKRSSGWLSWSSQETLKVSLNVSDGYQGCHPDDLSVSVFLIAYIRHRISTCGEVNSSPSAAYMRQWTGSDNGLSRDRRQAIILTSAIEYY